MIFFVRHSKMKNFQIAEPMSPKSAEERDGESEANEAEESEESLNYSEDSNPNYFPGNVKTIC